ncbi:MAG: DUF262 domain-containing protein [bacterium]|nr:DUF262 domain-containing protein [bacterium]
MELEKEIDQRIGEVRTESLDLSFGEIVNLHANKELVIQPEYQRLFRWSPEQKSRLIESILLELPIPQIFVIENEDGVYELIDGLQRISSVLQFIEPTQLALEEFSLIGCDLVKELNGRKNSDLPLSLRLRLKRSSLRTIVIKRQSKSFLRYEMFKRLNTGGAILAPQEIRNCSARMLGELGAKFYSFLQTLSADNDFVATTQSLASAEMEQKGNEELVLRFLAGINSVETYRGNVRDWLDDFMESVLTEQVPFNLEAQEAAFRRVFSAINAKLGETAFVKFRGASPVGGLAPAYFEAVALGSAAVIDQFETKSPNAVKDRLVELVQSDDFREVTGPGANNRTKLKRRIELVKDCIVAT